MRDPTLIVPLWQVLCATAALACLTRNVPCARAAMGLLVNWSILTWYASMTGHQYDWWLNGAVDYVTVLAVLIPVNKIGQWVLLMTYAIGMTFHGIYGVKAVTHAVVHTDTVHYWWRFHYLAWFQAAIMLGWAGVVGGINLVHWFDDWRRRESMGSGRALARGKIR